jgi:hypothetical protein
MSFLNKALELATKGFYVFPVQPGGKLPAIDDFPNRATRDPDQIKKFWIDPVMGFEQPYNIGISTTKFNGSQALVVVDVDNKGKKKGSAELEKLIAKGYILKSTRTQKTPSGGRHLIYRSKAPVKQGADVLGVGLDIRSKGGYILAEGSVIDGKYYETEADSPTEECPEWVLAECGKAFTKELATEYKIAREINGDLAKKRAEYYLRTEAPLSIEGESGDQTAYKVAATIKDYGVTATQAVELMLDLWNDRCEPPWPADEIEKKVRNAFSYGVNQKGSASPEKSFSPVENKIEGGEEKSFLEKMNDKYALVFSEGGYSVLFETIDEKGCAKRDFLQESTFKRKFSPYLVQQGKGQAKSQAELWLDWSGRREYNGLCFRPEQKAKNGYYNLWRGFNFKSKAYAEASAEAKRGFDMYVSHIKENVCGSNDSLYTWLMGYFAHMIQKPYERPLTTLVFRGRKGVGKNVVMDRLGKLLGSGHYLVAHDGRYLTSNFNGHLDSCLCLVLDEAFWSGDKHAEGKLKGITTSETIMIERKGREPYVVDNLVRLVVIGNEDWLVPASSDERRYSVFDVGSGKKQDRVFFNTMKTLMDQKGGAEVLMHYLKNFDLEKVDVNDAPNTIGLIEQKLESMGLIEQFWLQCLQEGRIVNTALPTWPDKLGKSELRDAFSLYCRQRNIKSWVPSDRVFGREIKKMNPSIVSNKKVKMDDAWHWAYEFKSLEFMRDEWCKSFGIDYDWG